MNELNNDFLSVIQLIKKSQQKAIRAVNAELISLYWEIGSFISQKVEKSDWGKSVVEELALYIHKNEPSIKGFSDKNLWRMKQFYETYEDFPKLSSVLRENDEVFPDTIRDSYVFDFLKLPTAYTESELQKGLVKQMKAFILELGKDFLFISEEYRVQVGNTDFFIDLLFYHRGLQCLVAFELKTDKFKPEHLGQLNFYLEALDKNVKKENENPSIGILICKDKDQEVVEYALNRSLSPTMVSEYKTKLPDKKYLQVKLQELFDNEPENK